MSCTPGGIMGLLDAYDVDPTGKHAVVDAGYNPGNMGDIDFDSTAPRASLIAPVPGGVGPMTIATLLSQTTEAAARQLGLAPA